MISKHASPSVAWVTGAGKGIGSALAFRLASEGWTVAASSRTLGDLTELANRCKFGRIHSYPLDVTDPDLTAATIEKIETEIGEINLVILNAGTYFPTTIENFSTDKFRLLIETNLMGPVNSLTHIFPRFIARNGGTIAIVGSLAGYRGLPAAAGYGASKAALINMCEALKPELEKYNIYLSLINPGFVKTPLTDKNTFEMPFLISVDDAVNHIMKGLKKKDFEITFPWRFSILMKFLRILPDSLYFFLTRKILK